MSDEQFTCHDCGFIWLKGQHGGHDCKARILVRLERVKKQNEALECEIAELRTPVKEPVSRESLDSAWEAYNKNGNWGHEPTAKGLFEDGWNAALSRASTAQPDREAAPQRLIEALEASNRIVEHLIARRRSGNSLVGLLDMISTGKRDNKGIIYQPLIEACEAYMALRASQEPAQGEPSLPYPALDLIARAVKHPHRWEPGVPRWSAIGSIFSMGSGYSIKICQAFGVDPHEVSPFSEEEEEEEQEPSLSGISDTERSVSQDYTSVSPLSVSCPHCHARPWTCCNGPSGKKCRAHSERIAAMSKGAEEEGVER